MSKSKKLLSSAIALSLVMGMSMYELNSGRKETNEVYERPKGYEHKGKDQHRLDLRREHRKNLKAKKNVKQGIYSNKIKYHKNRKLRRV